MKIHRSAFHADVLYLTWRDLWRIVCRRTVHFRGHALIITLGSKAPDVVNAEADAAWLREMQTDQKPSASP
jgi:hypothetical protein